MKNIWKLAILAVALSLALVTPGQAEKTYGASGQMIQKQGVPGASGSGMSRPSYQGPSGQSSQSSGSQRSYSTHSGSMNAPTRDYSGYSVSKSNDAGQLLSKTGSSRTQILSPSHERPSGPYYRYQDDNRRQDRDDRSNDGDRRHDGDSRDRDRDRNHDSHGGGYFNINIGGDGYSLYYSNSRYHSGFYRGYSVGIGSPYYYPTYYYPTYYSSYGLVWVPGYWTTTTNQVLVPGVYDSVWVAPVYDWVWDGYQYQWVVVRDGYYNRAPRYYARTSRVWVPGCWR
ncbi:MAG: hypothetical protein V2A74_06435 [bacterium]